MTGVKKEQFRLNVSSGKRVTKYKSKKSKTKTSNKRTTKKMKKHKVKKANHKVSDEKSFKKREDLEPKYVDPHVTDKVYPDFCGFCGMPVNTSFCPNCGRKV